MCSSNCFFPQHCWVIALQLCPPGTHTELSWCDPKIIPRPKEQCFINPAVEKNGNYQENQFSFQSSNILGIHPERREMHPEYHQGLHFYLFLCTVVHTAKHNASRCFDFSVSTPISRTREYKKYLAGSDKWLISGHPWEDMFILPDINLKRGKVRSETPLGIFSP